MKILDALTAGLASPSPDDRPSPSAIELVWRGLGAEGAPTRTPLERLHALLAWLDRVESYPDLRAAFEELHEADERAGGDARALLATFAASPASRTEVPAALLPQACDLEQELAELIRAERTAAVARDGRAADRYLCLFDALLIGLERLTASDRPAEDGELVSTVTYLAAHPWVPAAPVPAAEIDAWRRCCCDDPELARALRLTAELRRRCGDDERWLMSVLGSGFAWLPLPA